MEGFPEELFYDNPIDEDYLGNPNWAGDDWWLSLGGISVKYVNKD